MGRRYKGRRCNCCKQEVNIEEVLSLVRNYPMNLNSLNSILFPHNTFIPFGFMFLTSAVSAFDIIIDILSP